MTFYILLIVVMQLDCTVADNDQYIYSPRDSSESLNALEPFHQSFQSLDHKNR